MERFEKRELAMRAVRETMRRIRQQTPPGRIDTFAAGESYVRVGRLDAAPVERVIIFLTSRGCVWANHHDGGCTMCGHYAGTTKGDIIPSTAIATQFDNAFSKYDFSRYPIICVYNAGSFLSQAEIPRSARQAILRRIGQNEDIKVVVLESRPEFVTKSNIEEIREALPGKQVEIGMGLECQDDEIRTICVNKSFTLQHFEAACKIIKDSGMRVLAYILLKPPFLTEKEGIEEAIKTIKYAFAHGVDVVSVEPVSIQEYTLVEALHRVGLYRVPWTWSAIEVVKATHDLGEVRLGGFEFYPAPKTIVHNCEKCDEQAYRGIAHYNTTGSLDYLIGLDCYCKGQWEAELEATAEDLLDRILIHSCALLLEDHRQAA